MSNGHYLLNGLTTSRYRENGVDGMGEDCE